MDNYFNPKKEKLKKFTMGAIIIYSLFMFIYWCIDDSPNPIKYEQGIKYVEHY
jgi:hypothetical protein